MEFGKSLRAARETRGYTVSQLAEATHLAPTTIESLENEDFSHIPAPIYGRGFVKLYCEGVGLEPKPFVDEFMEIMNGNREPSIRERPTVAAAPAPEIKPEPAPEPAPAVEPEPAPANESEPVSESPVQDLFSAPEPTISRYATPYRESGRREPSLSLPAIPIRLVALAVGALVLIFLLGWGIRALYRATMPAEPAEEAQPAAAEQPAAPKAVAQSPAAPRTPQAIPDLYLY